MNVKQFVDLTTKPRIRAFSIAVIVLALLAVLQVNNLKKNAPMCELLNDCKLQNSDIQRMQIALSQSGLSNFKVEDNRLLVPKDKHATYLQAVANNNAIPEELRDELESGPSLNPFLSRTQQLALEKAEKKRQIRDMIIRLPFVDHAWFEMDQTKSSSAFRKSTQSAVVSIRPPGDVHLTDHHVDTVKRMVDGAVAGLKSEEIVVIDLSAGFAHQEHVDPQTTQQVHFQRVAFEQKRVYENRIREALKDYPGLSVTVTVDVAPDETPAEDQTAFAPTTTPIPVQQVSANVPLDQELRVVGANGVASIDDFPSPEPMKIQVPEIPVMQAIATKPSPNLNSFTKSVSVAIDVPQTLIYEIFGPPNPVRIGVTNQSELQASIARETQVKFEQFREEIIQKVQPLLSDVSYQNQAELPIAVNLIRQPLNQTHAWVGQVKEFVSQNWPSAAVLIIGLVLLSMVTKKHTPVSTIRPQPTDQDVVTFESSEEHSSEPSRESEVRLSQMIEKDPDAAAKVIEAWIRDAA